MRVSDKCIGIIKECEGFSSKPYLCPAGIPTIGYGSTRYEDGRRVTMQDAPISQSQAEIILFSTLDKEYSPAVNRYVQVPLTQCQFDALVDFAYNCGTQNLRTSTLLKLLNAGDFAGASVQFDKWVRGGGKVLPGLVKRRRIERELFEGNDGIRY